MLQSAANNPALCTQVTNAHTLWPTIPGLGRLLRTCLQHARVRSLAAALSEKLKMEREASEVIGRSQELGTVTDQEKARLSLVLSQVVTLTPQGHRSHRLNPSMPSTLPQPQEKSGTALPLTWRGSTWAKEEEVEALVWVRANHAPSPFIGTKPRVLALDNHIPSPSGWSIGRLIKGSQV